MTNGGETQIERKDDRLAAAIAFIRRGIRADGSNAGCLESGSGKGAGADCEALQWRLLETWALGSGLVLGPGVPGPERLGGMEVDVRFDAGLALWWKFTNPGFAGFTVRWFNADDPRMVLASPLEYLERLVLGNEIFDIGAELRGIWWDPSGAGWRIVTTQPDAIGSPASHEQILSWMEELGWRLMPFADVGRFGALSFIKDDVALWDVHPANVVLLEDGTLMPVDIILTRR